MMVDLAVTTSLMEKARGYHLPGNPDMDVMIVPVSGGADSTVMADMLHLLFPNVKFHYPFTDTGSEHPDNMELLEALENATGRKIDRPQSEKDFFGLIKKFNGFLPGPTDRWCTRELKLEPFRRWIQQFDGRNVFMFTGIRADESQRLAFAIDGVETVMPFVELGISRKDVFAHLQERFGIPASYKVRSRSGCFSCFFQRRSERVGLLQERPVEFHRAAGVEKLPASDLERHKPSLPLHLDSGISPNWLSLPFPSEDDRIAGRVPKDDMFGRRIFVGGEAFFDGYINPFCWHQRVVSYSPSLAGIKRQLDDRFQHLLSVAEAYGMEPEDVRIKARFAIWVVELPAEDFDPYAPGEGAYAWHAGESYKQLEHIVGWVTRALQADFERQQAARTPPLLSVEHEWAETARQGLARLLKTTGSVIGRQWYAPKEKAVALESLSDDEVLKSVACPMCQI